jgi:hypothetical protein
VLLATGYISVIQTTAHDRGSAFAAFGLVNAVGQGFGLVAAGVLQPASGLLPLLEIQGCLYLLAGIVMIGRRERRAAGSPESVGGIERNPPTTVENGAPPSTS